jgi:hypothetical protein
MQVANTLAYYDTAIITAVKSFIVQAHGLKMQTEQLKKTSDHCSEETYLLFIKTSFFN